MKMMKNKLIRRILVVVAVPGLLLISFGVSFVVAFWRLFEVFAEFIVEDIKEDIKWIKENW